MTKLLSKYLLNSVFRAPEGGDGGAGGGGEGGGDPAAAAGGDKTPESLLFPKEGEGGDKPADPPAGDPPATEWKEYVNDPAKSEAENATAKAEHDKTKPADDKDKNKDDPANKVPEDGKYTLTMPEGVELDQEMLDAIGPDFKELGLTNAQAQKLTDKFIKIQTERTEARMKDWGETLTKWVADAKADKEIGGDKFDGSVKNAHRFLGKFGTPALRDYLNASGGGNHPELIRVFAKAGELIREDNPATGGAEGAGKPADPAHVLFPNDAPKG